MEPSKNLKMTKAASMMVTDDCKMPQRAESGAVGCTHLELPKDTNKKKRGYKRSSGMILDEIPDLRDYVDDL